MKDGRNEIILSWFSTRRYSSASLWSSCSERCETNVTLEHMEWNSILIRLFNEVNKTRFLLLEDLLILNWILIFGTHGMKHLQLELKHSQRVRSLFKFACCKSVLIALLSLTCPNGPTNEPGLASGCWQQWFTRNKRNRIKPVPDPLWPQLVADQRPGQRRWH